MMKKIFLLAFLFIVGVFILPEKSFATAYDQTITSSSTVANGLSAFQFNFGTPLNLDSITLKIAANNSTCDDTNWKIDILQYDGSNPAQVSGIPGTHIGDYYQFNLSTTTALTSGSVWVAHNGVISCGTGSWNGWDFSGSASDTTYWGKLYASVIPEVKLNFTPNVYGVSIDIIEPQANTTTTNFSYWIVSGIGNGAGTYETGVIYYDMTEFGINSTTPTYTDRGTSYTTSTPGTFSFNNRIQKKVDLNPNDAYEAYAYLMRGIDILATSSPIQFGARVGVPSTYPSTYSTSTSGITFGTNTPVSLWNDDWCKDTSFSVLGADFGKGICKVFAFLFVPGEYVNLQYEKFVDVLQYHAPFSYFYDMNNAISNLSPTTTAMSSLTLSTGTSTPIQVSFSAISSSTIDKYTTSTSRSLIRTLVESLLYLAFGFMVIIEARHLFKPTNSNLHK